MQLGEQWDDEVIHSTLLDIAIIHVKLALEYSDKKTLSCRNEDKGRNPAPEHGA